MLRHGELKFQFETNLIRNLILILIISPQNSLNSHPPTARTGGRPGPATAVPSFSTPSVLHVPSLFGTGWYRLVTQATGQNWAEFGPVAFWPGPVTGSPWRRRYRPKFSSRYLAVTSPLKLSPCHVKVRVTGNLPKNGYGPIAGEWLGYSALKSKPPKFTGR